MIRSICVLCALLAFGGCAAPAPKPESVQLVSKAVAVGCLGDQPARPVDVFRSGAYPGEKAAAQAALIDREAWRTYALRLEVSQEGCDRKLGAVQSK